MASASDTFTVGLRAVEPRRLSELGDQLSSLGYRVQPSLFEPTTTPTGPPTRVDAVVVDASRTDVEQVLHWWEEAGAFTPALIVVPGGDGAVATADRRPLLPVGVSLLKDDPGAEQETSLLVALACRRGRTIRSMLAGQGVTLTSHDSTVRLHDGASVVLTPVEFSMLRALVVAAGGPVSRRSLLAAAGPRCTRTRPSTVDSHVRGIRQKLLVAGVPLRIRTVHGVGFSCGALAASAGVG